MKLILLVSTKLSLNEVLAAVELRILSFFVIKSTVTNVALYCQENHRCLLMNDVKFSLSNHASALEFDSPFHTLSLEAFVNGTIIAIEKREKSK